jgi:hypothetical protein
MAKQPGDQQCATCSAWIPIADSDGFGNCKAHPPVPLFGANIGQPGSGRPELVFFFPMTPEFEWCREYKAETPAS